MWLSVPCHPVSYYLLGRANYVANYVALTQQWSPNVPVYISLVARQKKRQRHDTHINIKVPRNAKQTIKWGGISGRTWFLKLFFVLVYLFLLHLPLSRSRQWLWNTYRVFFLTCSSMISPWFGAPSGLWTTIICGGGASLVLITEGSPNRNRLHA